jgi:outer membrane PBP1 activator LpoA protein|tara:strand:- start:2307 stop:4172 length:1866 start_codon:yes stop_codon:yes gene_type:complete
MTKRLFLSMIYALAILAFIGGCAPTTTQVSGPIARVTLGSEDFEINESLVSQAELALARISSVEAYRRDNRLLDIAILFAQGGDLDQSRTTLQLIDSDRLNDSFFIEYSLLGLELDLAGVKLTSAKQRLSETRFIAVRQSLEMNFQRRILDLESALNYAGGDIKASIENTIQLGSLYNQRKMTDQRLIANLHDRIWLQLSELPFNQLQQSDLNDRGILAGWLELAAAMRYRQADPSAKKNVFAIWEQSWPEHPGAKTRPAALTTRFRSTVAPKSIALLLPLQGQYETPSTILLNGFISAYYENLAQGASLPKIAIYDTSEVPVTDVYNNAVERGADLIIGPLRQSQVEILAASPRLPVPTLTLNRLDKNQIIDTQNLLQFGLSALDEVSQIADQAWIQGQTNVLLIAPDSGWGQRAQSHFIDYWTAKGGAVIDAISYPNSVNDFTRLLQRPLEIDLSEQRSLALRRSVNRNLNSTARRRQDIDLVIVLGYSEKVRQIKPALDFLYAGDLPVYATSHIYSGTQQIDLNRDLSGIKFSAMPWTLEGHMPRPLKPDERLSTAYRQLYALGYDAFLLHALLENLARPDALPVFGATGMLRLSEGSIKRTEKWAAFKNGRVVAAQP